jgi:hypothetical protein
MNDHMTVIANPVKDKKVEFAMDKLINSDISGPRNPIRRA